MRIKLDANDTLFSKMIRERDGNRCVFCGKDGLFNKLENSHFWGRGCKRTRFDPLNCDALCFQCHMNNESNKQGFYREWKIEQLGAKLYEALRLKAMIVSPYGKYEKGLISTMLKSQYKAKQHLLPNWEVRWYD